jgi:hypothetical protein
MYWYASVPKIKALFGRDAGGVLLACVGDSMHPLRRNVFITSNGAIEIVLRIEFGLLHVAQVHVRWVPKTMIN